MSCANQKTLADETWTIGCATVSSSTNRPGKCANRSCSWTPKPQEPNPEARLTVMRKLRSLWPQVDSLFAEYTSFGERYHSLSRRARSSPRVHEYGHELMRSEFQPVTPGDDHTPPPGFPDLILEYAKFDSTARKSSAWRECVDRMEILSEDLTNMLEEIRQVVEALEAVDAERTRREVAEDDAVDDDELHAFAAAGAAGRPQGFGGRADERANWIGELTAATRSLRSVIPGDIVPFVIPSLPCDGWAAPDARADGSVAANAAESIMQSVETDPGVDDDTIIDEDARLREIGDLM